MVTMEHLMGTMVAMVTMEHLMGTTRSFNIYTRTLGMREYDQSGYIPFRNICCTLAVCLMILRGQYMTCTLLLSKWQKSNRTF